MALRDQPYLPLYVMDFISDERLAECSAESTGVYIRLMCIMHKMEDYGAISLKAKDKQTDSNIKNFAIKLSRQMPFPIEVIERALSELLDEGVLTLDEDRLYQRRMVRDGELSRKRAEAGKMGGRKPKPDSTASISTEEEHEISKTESKEESKTQANTEIENENENEIETDNEYDNPKESEEKKTIDKPSLVQERWEQFWKAYPRKSGKGAAEKSFKKIAPNQALFELIMQQLEQAKASKQWLRDGGDFIPYPATWLNQKRWGDEYVPAKGQPRHDDKPWDWNRDSPFAEWGDSGDG